jgi:hypothetical protein
MLPAPGTELSTAEEMIEALGGPVEVAELFKLKDYRVPSMWRSRGRIPPVYRPAIAEMLEQRGYRCPPDFVLHPTKA